MARPIAVIDCETDPFLYNRKPEPFIWGFFDGKLYREFTRVEELIEFLAPQKLIVYAHNGGKFDYVFFLDQLEPYDEVMIINGRLAKFKIGSCEFRDSINILPVALKEYEKDEFDYTLMEKEQREKPENLAKIREYLRHDCLFLYELVTGFVKQYGRHLTQATAAVRQWQKMSKTKPPKSTADFYEQYSSFYFGGRVECFKRGILSEIFNVYDINSAYPYAMLHQHPFSVEAEIIEGAPDEICGNSFYEIEATSLGALPYRETTGKLIFPKDDVPRNFTCTGWELQAGLSTSSVQVHKFLRYHTFAETRDFSDYIMHFWTSRKKAKAEGDKRGDLYYKLLMNSLYGKFAANPSKYKRHILVDPSDGFSEQQEEEVNFEGEDYYITGHLGKWLLAERKLYDEEQRFYNVATGASITGFVRAHLWRAIHSCGIDNVLYCDTDSLAITHAGEYIQRGAALGEWKDEGQYARAGIAGKKLYIFERDCDCKDKRKCQCIKKASKGARLTDEQIWKVARGEKVKYFQDAPTFRINKGGFTFTNRDIVSTY